MTASVDPDQVITGAAIGHGKRKRACVAFTDDARRPDLVCQRSRKRWDPLVPADELSKYGTLADCRSSGPNLLCLFRRTERSSQISSVVRIRPDGSSDRAGRPIRSPRAIVFLGLCCRPSVLIQELGSAHRYIVGLDDGRWRRTTPKLKRSDGPLVGGSALSGDTQLVPVVETSQSPWSFSVYRHDHSGRWRGSQLSGSRGDAQGNLSQPNRSVWAIWQENDYSHGSFDTRIRVSRYLRNGSSFSTPATAFKGLSAGPGDLQVARWHGRNYLLFMRPRSPEKLRTLNAFVSPLRWP